MTALLDFLKNKEEKEKAAKGRKPAKVSVEKETEKKTAKKAVKKEAAPKVEVANTAINSKGFSFEVIKEPHISEKGSFLAEINQYTFQVSPNYSKQEIKKAIEGIYGVNVLSVNTIKIPHKKRRLGKTQGFRKKFKKAVVKIKEGQKIEIL